MKRILALMSAAIILLAASGCESSGGREHAINDSWHDPAFSGPIRFNRTLVIALTPDVLVRRSAEDAIVRHLGEGRSVQAHKLLNESDRWDSSKLRPKCVANGIDGIISLRLISTKNDVSWVPGNGLYPYDPFWASYDRSWPAARDPSYLKGESSVRVQTNIYSAADGKLIWTAISESFPPGDAQKVIVGICDNIARQLDREGLLR